MNRLKSEKSPYLLMHGNNPVNWYPWCDEAFEDARAQDKPIFLSIGYSSCHWCHVIAHESFEDREIADLLNENFISIKVDKEERPDVDAVYMDAVQLTTGAGGWPMTLLATPSGEPFFAATYLPRTSRGGALGLRELLRSAARLWREEHQAVLRAARDITSSLREAAQAQAASAEPSLELLKGAVRAYARAFDGFYGGFGRAPKFPDANSLLFLLRYHERTGDETALNLVTGTLDGMFKGGLFDHVGGGFCRYSVDEKWLVPHFEKMLYDNALLLLTYAQGWRATGKALYRAIARRTADYVLKEMSLPGGAFCSAQDADSEGEEGAYYLLRAGEITDLLGKTDGERFNRWYGITEQGNFEGKSIPNLIGNTNFAEEEPGLASLRERVYEYRKSRRPLGLDDKVLTAWNALMIAALAYASRTLEEPRYLEAAIAAERFLLKELTDGDTLLLRYREGEARGMGVLADYAYLALALTELFSACGDKRYLEKALRLAKQIPERFGDGERGGYFLYSAQSEPLITRPKEVWDAAMPSGNACAALALSRLAAHTGDAYWQREADRQLRFIAGAAETHPTGHGFGLLAISDALSPSFAR